MSRAVCSSLRPVVVCRSRIRVLDRSHPETNRRRGIWMNARGKGRGRNRGGASENDEPSEEPMEKTPEPVVESSVEVNPAPDSKEETEENLEEEVVSPWKEDRLSDIKELKKKLLTMVAGYDRGFAAIPRDVARVRNVVESLETLSGSIDLSSESTAQPDVKDLFDGTWRLVFTSAFDSGNMTQRPGANLPFSPFTFGPVYQVVNTKEERLENVVELLLTGVPRLPWTPSNAVPRLRVTLSHELNYSMSTVNITLKTTKFKLLDSGFELPSLTTKPIPLAVRDFFRRQRAGSFNLVYLDEDLRITEGDRSRLRIFVKTDDLEES